jgi:hypothetical protein
LVIYLNCTMMHGLTNLKFTDNHSEYVIFVAFSQQQRLHERASVLCYTCTACLITKVKHIGINNA